MMEDLPEGCEVIVLPLHLHMDQLPLPGAEDIVLDGGDHQTVLVGVEGGG